MKLRTADSTPPVAGIANQPGLPRKPEEVKRGEAIYQVKSCEVTSAGGRIDVSFPGVKLGVFDGRLEYTVYKGTNLIAQAIVAKTEERSVAYKYEAGLKGLTIQPASRVVWRDMSNLWQEYRLGGAKNDEACVALKAANRLVVAEGTGGLDRGVPAAAPLLLGARDRVQPRLRLVPQGRRVELFASASARPRTEEPPHDAGRGAEDTRQNFALHSARPGTWQRMPVFFYVSVDAGQPATRVGARLHA